MKLTKKEVDHLALLARIGLAEEEKEKFGEQISSILDYVSKLNEVDTADVSPMLQPGGGMNVSRADQVLETDEETRKLILQNFPDRDGDLLKTKAVFEETPEEF